MASIELKDVVDIPELKAQMEAFYKATSIPVGILDPAGNILVATGWQEICTKYHRVHPGTLAKCKMSDDYIKAHLKVGEYIEYKCQNNLWDLATPIVIKGQHVATLFTGQFFYEEEKVSGRAFIKQAEEYGFPLDGYLDALEKVPVFSRQKVKDIMDYYMRFVQMLIKMGMARLELENFKANLQKLVDERTDALRLELHERKKAEELARVERKKLQNIVDALGDGVYIVNQQYDIEYVNPVIEREFGPVNDRKCYEYFHDRTESCPWCKNKDVFEGKSVRWEWYSPKNKRHYDLFDTPIKNADGTTSKFEIFHDVTEHKKLQEAMRESEERYRSLFHASKAIMLIIEPETGKIADANASALSFYGYAKDEIRAKTIYEINTLTPSEIKAAIDDAETERRNYFVFRHRLSSGEIRDVESYSSPIKMGGKAMLYSIVHDITERKKAELALEGIKWLLKEESGGEEFLSKIKEYEPDYGDLTALNKEGEIIRSVDKEILYKIVNSYLGMLGTSSAIYEKNGDYAAGIFSSSWCRLLDVASRKRCDTEDNRRALSGGKWLCHESCWSEASKVSITEDRPADIECYGGIRLYAVPIRAEGGIVGSINFGYGSPPTDPKELEKIAERFSVNIEDITRVAKEYKTRPPYIIELAKQRLRDSASLIGILVERKRAEDELRKSEERFRRTLDNMLTGCMIIGFDWKYIYVNDIAARHGLKKPDELLGRTIIEMYPGVEESEVFAHYRICMEKRIPQRFVSSYTFTDGTTQWYEFSVVPAPEGIFVASQDITDRKKSEDELRKSEAMFSSLARVSPVGIFRANREGASVYVNDRWCQISGMTREESLGTGWSSAIHPDDKERVFEGWYASVRERSQFKMEFRVKKPDGSVVWMLGQAEEELDKTGKVLGYVGTITDITDRKRAEEALQKSNENLMKIMENSPVPMALTDPEQRIVFLNRRFTEVFGYTIADIPTVEDWWPRAYPEPSFREKMKSEWNRRVEIVIRDGSVFPPMEAVVVCKDGGRREIVFNFSFIGERGLTIFHDISERKEVEEKLRESQRALSEAQKVAHIGSWEMDLQSGKGVWSDESYRIFGYEPGGFEPSFETFIAMVHPEDRRKVEAFLPEIMSGKLSRAELDLRIIRHDGQERVIHDQMEIITDQNGKPVKINGVNYDVTERLAAEKALRDSESLLKTVLEHLPVGVWILNAKGGVVFGNETAEKIWAGKHLVPMNRLGEYKGWRVESGEEVGPHDWAGARALEKGETSVNEEVLIQCFDGTKKFILDSGIPIRAADGSVTGAVTVNLDITDRKNAEQEKEQLMNELSRRATEKDAILASQNNVILTYDLNMDVQQVNPSFLRIYGFNPVGLNIKEVIRRVNCKMADGSPLNLAEQPTPKALRGETTESRLYMVTKADGTTGFVDTSSRPLLVDGKIVGSVTVWHDITDLKMKERELSEAKEAAESANNQKDKFVSLVTHDLVSPLAGMLGFLKLVRSDSFDKLADNSKKMVDISISTAENMVMLIQDILSISRLRSGSIKPQKEFFDASLIGKKMSADYQFTAQSKGITLENTIPDHTSVYSDKTLLTEAIQNYVTNAIKFCGRGDRITISAEKGEHITIFVSDTGPGMNPALIRQLLGHEGYRSTPGTEGEKGTGYGLMMTREVLDALGCAMLIEPGPEGKGSRFGARVPYVRPRILLVDDEPFGRVLIKQYLKHFDVEITEAENGAAAMEKITKGKELPHLIISDIEMPLMTGLELLSELQKRPETKSIPVIIVSGRHGMEIRDAVYQLGAKDYLTKALDVDDFVPRVRRFIS